MGHLTRPLNPPKKQNTKNKTKQNKKQHKKTKKNQNKQRKSKKHKNTKKELFSYQSKFSFFLTGYPKIAFFDTLAQKTRTQKHYKNRGFSQFFLERSYASRNGHFWTKKNPNSEIPVIIFLAFFLIQKQKTQKSAETPICIVF